MSIENLKSSGLLDFEVPDSQTRNTNTTIAFALDAGYLEYFKVMLVSMAHTGTLINCPIALYTDDANVFDDPIVKLTVDKKRLIPKSRQEIIYDLAKNNVQRPERGNWNKGTFLKWSVFEKQETDQLLFLDVDMICLQKLEGLFSIMPDKNLLTSPQFQLYLKKEKKDQAPKILENLSDGKFDKAHAWRINSGLMLIRRNFLSNDFFNEITNFAKSRVDFHEQAHLSSFFKEKKELHGMISSKYNFQENYLKLLSVEMQVEMAKKIAVLHYAGGEKPWSLTPNLKNRYTSLLWHSYRTLAQNVLDAK